MIVSSSASWLQVALPALWMFSMRLSAQTSEDIEIVLGGAVSLSLAQSRVTVKEAAALMRIDESQLRHCLRGDKGYHLSLNRLLRLPFLFWLNFGPSLIYLVAKKNMAEIAEDIGFKKQV